MAAVRELWSLARSVAPIVGRALRSGQVFRPSCEVVPADPDVLAEYDVAIPVSGGFSVTANVFRSRAAAGRGEPQPVVMCAHPYDNSLIPALGKTPLGGPPQQYRLLPQVGRPRFSEMTSWEAPDTNFWVRAGYAVVNMNLPGYATSGGPPSIFSEHQGAAFYEAIEWVASRPWCTGDVGLNGVSYLAISQYHVAACRAYGQAPPSLRCICPWEGVADMYRELLCPGGVREVGFPAFWWFTELQPVVRSVDALIASEGCPPLEMHQAHPLFDDYWRAKVPDFQAIDLPMLVCASFSDQGVHNPGSFTAYSRVSSTQKWMYTHRSLKWDVFYSDAVQELQRRFFDCFVRGRTDNGFLETAPVRLEVRSSRDRVHEVREEQEWPPARTRYERLYLDGTANSLVVAPPPEPAEVSYPVATGQAVFRHTFGEDTELTGHMMLRLWVEARSGQGGEDPDDMILCVGIDKRDRRGESVRFYGAVGNRRDMVSRGFLAVSCRTLDPELTTAWRPVPSLVARDPIAPGQVVEVDIELYPSSTFFAAGESLDLIVSPREVVPSPPFRKDVSANRGIHVLHCGGERPSFLQVPRIATA